MRQVQIGRLYIIYRTSSQANKAGVQKAYRLHPFDIPLLNLLYKFYYPLKGGENKTWKFQFCSLCFIVSFFLSYIWCMQILNIPNNCSTNRDLPFLLWSCVWATIGRLRHWNSFEDIARSHSDTSLASNTMIVHVCSCAVGCFDSAGSYLWLWLKGLTLVLCVYHLVFLRPFSATENTIVYLDTFWIFTVWYCPFSEVSTCE